MNQETFTFEDTYVEKLAAKQRKWSLIAKLSSSITFVCIPVIGACSGFDGLVVAGISLLVVTAIYFQFRSF